MNLNAFNTALATRDAIVNICKSVIGTERPEPKMATVKAVDRVAMKATVLKEDDTEPVTLPFSQDDGPWGPGDLVWVETRKGMQKIGKTIYSAYRPGGTYVKPAFFNPVIAGGVNNDTVALQHYVSRGLDPGDIANAFYVGRWTNDVFILGWAEVVLTQAGNAALVSRYSFPLYGGTTGGAWTTVRPDKRGNAGTTFAMDLEISMDDDGAGGTDLEFRIRQSAAGTGAGGPVLFEMWLHGTWVQDLTATEMIVVDPAPIVAYPMHLSDVDIWHNIGASGEPPFQNGWVNFDTVNFGPAQYFKDGTGFVHMSGLVKSGTVGIRIFTLPVGYRPNRTLTFIVNSNSLSARVDVEPDGDVFVRNYTGGGSNASVALDPITFYAFA